MSCSTTTSEWLPSSERNSSAVRSVSSSVMPATGSSSSSRRGFWISSMPISSHCFWPCESAPAVRCAWSFRWIRTSVSPIRSSCAPERRKNSEARTPRSALSASSRFSNTERCSNTVGFWNLRPMPTEAISFSRRRSRSIVEPKKRLAGIGPGLAGDDVHHRRLAGAVRADDAAHLAGADRERERVERLEAVEADGDVVEVEDRAVGDVELARLDDARVARLRARPSCRPAAASGALLGGAARVGAGAHQVGRHDALPLPCGRCGGAGARATPSGPRSRPTMPCGRNRVTAMNIAPSTYSQYSGRPA